MSPLPRSPRALLLITVAFLGACSASPTPAAPPSPSSEPATDAAPAASSSATSPSADPIAAPAPSASAAASVEPPKDDSPKDSGPPPLTPDEQKKLEKTCKPLVAALQKKTQKRGGPSPLDALSAILKSPPKMPTKDLDVCSGLLERSIRDYMAAAIETEARVTLTMIAKGMIGAYSDAHAFCPPTSAPVPKDVAAIAKEPYYTSTSADWSAPTWKCASFDMSGQRQRFQYEVRTDPAGKWFEAIARGAPRGDGRMIEIVQRGQIKGDKIELPPVVKR